MMSPAPGRAEAEADASADAGAAATWRALGTLVHLVVTDPRCLAEARSILEADLAAVDLACSRFRADSEVCALQARGARQVSPLLAEAIAVALRAAELTDGDVDPTVGAAMSAIGYDRDFEQIKYAEPARHRADGPWLAPGPPGGPDLDHARRHPARPRGYRQGVGCRPVRRPDRATDRLRGAGRPGRRYRGRGPRPEGGWRIRVQDVTGSPGGPYALITIRDGGLATSSTTARRWQRSGDVLHHILDPRTGLPAEPVWHTVSVAAGTCADANAVGTAAVIRGQAALGWLGRLGLPSRLVDATGVVFTVAGWPEDAQSELSQK